MIFHDEYELLALHGGDREIALPGKELSTGRAVLVHLLSGGYSPENQEVLVSIVQLPAAYRKLVLDTGDHDGIPYVVTELLPSQQNLRQWLAAAKTAPKQPAGPGRSGVWRIPAESKDAKQSAAPGSEPGEFTRLFQTVKAPETVPPASPKPEDLPTAAMPVPNLTPATPPAAPVPEPEPGEFTRMFRSVTPAATAPTASPAATPEPGEFTRMLRASVPSSPAAASAGPAATQPAAEPGEFTRMLRATEASVPAPVSPTPEPTVAVPIPAAPTADAAPAPGEFTRLLRATDAPAPAATAALRPAASAPAAPPPTPIPTAAMPQPAAPAVQAEPEAPSAGEFTRMFQASKPVTPPASKMASSPPPLPRTSEPGEFTRMMQSPLAPEPMRSQPTPAPAQPASEFTRMLQADQFTGAPPRSTPAAPAPSAPNRPPQAPGEFTRMFATDPSASDSLAMPASPQAPLPHGGMATGAFTRSASPAPPQVASGPSEFTQMFAAPKSAPAAAAPATQPAPPPKAQKSPLALILVLAGLFLLVVILIVVFALTR